MTIKVILYRIIRSWWCEIAHINTFFWCCCFSRLFSTRKLAMYVFR